MSKMGVMVQGDMEKGRAFSELSIVRSTSLSAYLKSIVRRAHFPFLMSPQYHVSATASFVACWPSNHLPALFSDFMLVA